MCVNYLSIHPERFSVHLGMLRVVLIGTGNVARQLCLAWKTNASVRVVQVVGRTKAENPELEGHPISPFEAILSDADCYIIAVNDSSIKSVNERITISEGLVVHTSGSISMDSLAPRPNRGVMYPLQTFSSGRDLDMSAVPFFLEAHDPDDKKVLEGVAASLSNKIHWLDSSRRRKLHVSAIFLNNFSNHLLYVSGQLCKEIGVDPEVLRPLLKETVAKAVDIGPYAAQTGPARRGDREVIEGHLDLIGDPAQREIYKAISQSIQTTYENELQKLT